MGFVCLWGLLSGPEAKAQDPQFSQFFAAPLYTNPGFTGSTQKTRFGLNYRNQWPSLQANFTTYAAYADHYIDEYNSGVGLMLMSDNVPKAGLSSTSAYLSYAYQVRFSEDFMLRPGVQLGYVHQSANYGDLLFGDMIDPFTGEIGAGGEPLDFENRGFFDLGFGAVAFYKEFWAGLSASHLTQPNISTAVDGDDPLPIKYVYTMGYKFAFTKVDKHLRREYAFTPVMLYKNQGDFSQLDVGTYFTFEPLVVGLWYRGLPFKPVEGKSNHESFVALVGYSMHGFNFGYSYDYTISDLGIKSGGAHEISISYTLFLGDPRKPPKHMRKLPCPQF
ncbi:hypothetical protein FUAX_16100 [Fulvitalea axinellae]|uniref:Type IX secretion system membrane protein PorP/SprF n=2 Tax=Fulvitalea axinellae TaxID=1182444 RepID=A0AAU9CGM9_9BACT|nr:hypothetical protein FUAX_16100 [Fulvitalea axinellae]